MAREGKKYVETVFKNFTEACGKHVASSWDDVGGWQLDHNSIYGGYVIHEVSNSSGGVSEPFGSTRMKASQFTEAMHFAMRALRAVEH